jgi:hypothetical protein
MDQSISPLAAATLRSFALDLLANYLHFQKDCALFGGALESPKDPSMSSGKPSGTASDG